MNIRGLGVVDPATLTPVDESQCGESPCGFIDNVWTRDSCLNYLATCDPTNTLYVGATQGALTVVGQTVGGAAAGAASETIGGLLKGLGSNQVGLLLLAGAFLLYWTLSGKRGRR